MCSPTTFICLMTMESNNDHRVTHSNRKPRIEKNTTFSGTKLILHHCICKNPLTRYLLLLPPHTMPRFPRETNKYRHPIRTKTVLPLLTTRLNSQTFLSFLESLDVRLLQPLISLPLLRNFGPILL